MKSKTAKVLKNSIIRVGMVTLGILMIPLIAMQYSREWNWSVSDFIIMGILLSLTGALIELVRHKVRKKKYRIAFVCGIVLMFLYVWAELAVGIFTNIGS